MATIDVRGKFVYMPGPWGLARPAAGVSLTIVDRDAGNPDDTIFTGTTNSSGEFSGTTSNWRDTVSVSVNTPWGSASRDMPDLADVPVLWLEARQPVGNLNRHVSLPCPLPLPGLPPPVVVLPWGPPGRTRVRVNGSDKSTLNDCVQAIQGIFGAGASIARAGANHEIVILGEQVGQLRQQWSGISAQIEALRATIEAQRDREQRAQGAVRQRHPVADGINSAARYVDAVRAFGNAAGFLAVPHTDPWEAIRQQIVALVQSMEQIGRNAAAQCGASGAALQMITKAITVAVSTFVASVLSAFVVGSLGTGGTVALAIAAIVSASLTIVSSMPALLNALAAMLSAIGANDAANVLRGASGDLSAWMSRNQWFGSLILLIFIVCALVLLMATAPADGWAWLVENISGSDGILGMRFVFSH